MNKHDTNEIKLNNSLLFDQGVKPKAEDAIKAIHRVLQDVLSDPEHYGKPTSVVALVENLEYTLQSLWRFTPDSKFHRYWFEVDGCLCSKLDNKDRVGSGYFVYNMECPFHGVSEQKDKECEMMEHDYMSVINNNIKIKCNNKDIYNLLIQDVGVERDGHGFVVTVNTHPANACLLFHTHDNRMYITSYMEDFECVVEFPTNVTKFIVESSTYKDVITLKGNPYGDLMDIDLGFTE